MRWNVRDTDSFRRSFKELPEKVRKRAKAVLPPLFEDPHAPALRLHRLRKPLANYWAVDVDESGTRIILRVDERKRELVLMDIGDHDVYGRF